MKHINVALFVPHQGCPHQCSFCNQKTISGKAKPLREDDIDLAVATALKSSDCKDGEIAFFGGSFTAIDRAYMVRLLERAKQYIDKGYFKGIRISTRPDCIDREVLSVLKKYGVTAIELGCQSMDNRVLELNGRGHTSEDVVNAASLIKAAGFELGVQMMTGLYGDTREKDIETARQLIALKPDTARIYPTVVLEGTELERLYKSGEYIAEDTGYAAETCAELLLMFCREGIRVIRLGLHSGGNVEDGYVAGAFHPAFREICESKIYLKKLLEAIDNGRVPKGEIEITVGKKYVSMLIGQKKSNINRLRTMGYECKILQTEELEKYEIIVRG